VDLIPTPEQKKKTAENEITSILDHLSQQVHAGIDSNSNKKFVNNMKVLIQSVIDDNMKDIKLLTEEIAVITTNMIELKETVNNISAAHEESSTDCYAMIRAIELKQKELEEEEDTDDEEHETLKETANIDGEHIGLNVLLYSIPLFLLCYILYVISSMDEPIHDF